tara:strand:- start:148 stop:435 length:288 start_codon:yes stop_codon:yes gene_type:complete
LICAAVFLNCFKGCISREKAEVLMSGTVQIDALPKNYPFRVHQLSVLRLPVAQLVYSSLARTPVALPVHRLPVPLPVHRLPCLFTGCLFTGCLFI